MPESIEPPLRIYERIAPYYDLIDLPFEYWRYRTIRPLLFAGLSGRLLDAGAGTGRNIAYYPPGAVLTGGDVRPAVRIRAARRRPDPATTLRLVQMGLARLDFADDSFDAA